MKSAGKQRSERGFTLFEVMIAATISIIVGGLVYAVYIGQQRNFAVGNSYLNIHEDSRKAMDWVAKDIRWAIEVIPNRVVPGYGTSITSDTCIILKVPSIDGAGDVIDIDNDHDYFIYFLNGAALERIVEGKSGVSSRSTRKSTVAENIGSLIFSYNGTRLSQVANLGAVSAIDTALTTSKTVTALKPVQVSEQLDTTTKLRNW